MLIIYLLWFLIDLSDPFLNNHSKNPFDQSIFCYFHKNSDGFDLTLHKNHSNIVKNCSSEPSSLTDLIAECLSKFENSTFIIFSHIVSLNVSHFCVTLSIVNLEPLKNLRRLLFHHCSIDFQTHNHSNVHHSYPKNLSRWSFDGGETKTFSHFMMMINALGRRIRRIVIRSFLSFFQVHLKSI